MNFPNVSVVFVIDLGCCRPYGAFKWSDDGKFWTQNAQKVVTSALTPLLGNCWRLIANPDLQF